MTTTIKSEKIKRSKICAIHPGTIVTAANGANPYGAGIKEISFFKALEASRGIILTNRNNKHDIILITSNLQRVKLLIGLFPKCGNNM